ncbi:MAG: SDR family oxidoreductase [Pseudomonadales bacterium]|nr:SDR family oxidoreductase [Pseudomonadales bacterium]MDP6972741.1 SDR family oxidoreductase [Pseudomonadales bacterium]
MVSTDRKSIFITGAASGMGRATAKLFAEKGWYVGGFDVNEAGLESLADELGNRGYADLLDVTDRLAFRSAFASHGERTNGTLDVLFNNAGIAEGGMFSDMEFDAIERVVNVNFMGVINGIYEGLPLLKATPNALSFTTSSSSGIFGIPGVAIYSATKHAVKGLTEALSVEFAAFDVRAADVLPGVIDTPILPDELKALSPKQGMWRLMPATAVAETVWKAYHDTRLHWYVPEELADQEKHVVVDPEAIRDTYLRGNMIPDTSAH